MKSTTAAELERHIWPIAIGNCRTWAIQKPEEMILAAARDSLIRRRPEWLKMRDWLIQKD